MSLQKPLHINILCQSDTLFHWLSLTLALGNIPTKTVVHSKPENMDAERIASLPLQKPGLMIIEEVTFKELLKTAKIQAIHKLPFPVLVLTNSFNSIKNAQHLELTFDTLPIQIITINLLEHAINSLMKDFALTKKLTNLAHFDPLTGAANRLLFEDRFTESLKRFKRFKESVSLVYFDLDGFKPVNDTYGHDVGDELLKRFVKLVKSVVRETDTVARMGGDEFVLIVSNSDSQAAANVVEKLVQKLAVPQRLNGHLITIQVSMGVVSVSKGAETEGLTSQQLLKKADSAVYKAKKITGTSVVYDDAEPVVATVS